METGAELPLEFQAKDLVRLRDQIDEAAKLADPKTRHYGFPERVRRT